MKQKYDANIDRTDLASDEAGQTLVVVAICMGVLMGFLGLAVDVGRFWYTQRTLQTAADAAAVAAALEIRVCGSVARCDVMQNAVKSALAENGYSNVALVNGCSGTSGNGLSVVLNQPPCAMGQPPPSTLPGRDVEVIVSQSVPTYFARVLGLSSHVVGARAQAQRISAPCIYALSPTDPGAITIIAGILVHSNCAVVDESNSSAALACLVGAFITAPKVSITGGTASLLCGLSTTPRTGVPVPTPADPLAYLPAPASGACGSSTKSPYTGSAKAVTILLGQSATFNPGVYCGGISITAGVFSNITFNPGVYILRQGTGLLGLPAGGLGLTISALANITGNGVMFYNEGPFGGFSVTAPAAAGLSTVNLSAATSGVYSGVLFFQAPSNTSSGTFAVSLLQGSKMEGAIYLPQATVSYGVSAISSAYNILVAKDINFDVTIASLFGDDYSALASGSPLTGDTAVLVQ